MSCFIFIIVGQTSSVLQLDLRFLNSSLLSIHEWTTLILLSLPNAKWFSLWFTRSQSFNFRRSYPVSVAIMFSVLLITVLLYLNQRSKNMRKRPACYRYRVIFRLQKIRMCYSASDNEHFEITPTENTSNSIILINKTQIKLQ